MKSIFLIVSLSVYCLAYSKPNQEIYKYPGNIKIVEDIPPNSKHKILIVSNRYFSSDEDYTYIKAVHPKRKMFWFVVGITSEAGYIASYNSLGEAMQVFSEDKNFLFFVHGHGNDFERVIKKGFEIGTRYNVNMIMFDWPTNYISLGKTTRNAKKVAENFANTVTELDPIIQQYYSKSKMSVMFHSMGNEIARELIKQDHTDKIPEYFFDNLILNAAAVKQKNHAQWVNELNIQNRVYIISNKDDFPLKGAAIMRMTKLLGSEYEKPLATNAQYLNLSYVAGKEHNVFLGQTELERHNPEIPELYNTLFQGEKPILENYNTFKRSGNSLEYFILNNE